jgi:sec-independent protein translocase protein TatC
MTDSPEIKPREGEKYMSFFEHLEELRYRLLRSVVAIVLGAIVAGIFHKRIFFALTRSIPELYWHTPLEPYFTFLKLAVVVGVFIAFPYVLFELWRFVSPGLYQKEKKYLLPFIGSAWVLFLTGALFVYFIMLPFISEYLYGAGLIRAPGASRSIEERWQSVAELVLERPAEISSATEALRLEQLRTQIQEDLNRTRQGGGWDTHVGNVWSVGKYVNLSLILFLAFGVAFDLPVVIVTLTMMGVVKPKTLAKARPIMLVLIFLIAAILTPPDPVSQIMMGLPMYLLFEASLWISVILLKFKAKNG